MGAKGEALARHFEAKAKDAAATALGEAERRGLEEGDRGGEMDGWRDGAPPRGRSRGGRRHRQAGLRGRANTWGNFTTGMLDQMNAQHAKEHANCTKAETAALLQERRGDGHRGVDRGLSDDQLAKSGIVFTDAPPMTAEQLVQRGLIMHIDEHFGSIRKTVGR